jgi:hypothetical protein
MNKSQLKEALEVLKKELEETKTKLENNERSLKYSNEDRDRYKKQVEELHLTLDGVNLAPPRKVKNEDHWNGHIDLTVNARFTGFCAALIHRQFEPQKTTTTKEEITKPL